MKNIAAIILPALLALKISAAPLPSARLTGNFDAGWLFLRADPPGAERPDFSDAAWRKLDLPHDWSIEGPFAKTNPSDGAGAFLPAGGGWYRKHFLLPDSASNRCVSAEFDGVMANSDVWINGFHLGHRPNGYVGLDYELTGHLNFGGDNVIAVRCDNSVQPASRFYCGAGIYRHVRLVETEPIHFSENGIFISTPQVSETNATVKIQMQITNESNRYWNHENNRSNANAHVITEIFDPAGKLIPFAEEGINFDLDPHENNFSQVIEIYSPELWSLESPQLYTAVTEIWIAGKLSDRSETKFGIREFHFDAGTGFWLNGKNFKIKGVCLHEDGGAFGMAVPAAVWQSRLTTLKSLGVNAVRTAHNPPAPEFLDLCDRMGLLVMDELFDCWTVGKQGLDGVKLADYHLYFNDWSRRDAADTVRRDRNHPSIILYSTGNEIHDTPDAEHAKKILAGLVGVFHANDPTRPVTQALFRPNQSHDYDDGLADMLDVVGQNYRENEILAAHAQKAARKIIGTENHDDRATWLALRDHAPYAGQFIWTGADYLGESRAWPTIGSGSGFLDRTGEIKPAGDERQSWWSAAPMVAIARRISRGENQAHFQRPPQLLADWTPENSGPHDENVEVYSNCKEVELFLKGKSLGTKTLNADAAPRSWTVPFAPGILRAIASDENGKAAATAELRTAGKPAQIILSASKGSVACEWDDVCEITAKITDKNGIRVPSAGGLVSFQVSGAGKIAAVDSADNAGHEPFQAVERHAFEGRCVAFVKAAAASGKIILTASAPGLTPDSIAITISEPLVP
jgi:beta-galactosidase